MPWTARPIPLPAPGDTAALAKRIAPALGPGDTLLLDGELGAGKTHFARALIRHRIGEDEEVPSPTFTLVQTYLGGDIEIWHCDLYRLSGPADLAELGLDDAFDSAICLVEWPDRLAGEAPPGALTIALRPAGDGRVATLSSSDPAWADRLADALG